MLAYVAVCGQGDKDYRYLQIYHLEPVNGRPRRGVLASLGNADNLSPQDLGALVASLSRLASPDMQLRLAHGDARLLSAKTYGSILAVRALWEDLGLPGLIEHGEQGFSIERALFRLVANRLVDPGEPAVAGRMAASEAHWPEPGHFSYHEFPQAMDMLLRQKDRLKAELSGRVRQLLSLPLSVVWCELTSSYLDTDGVCPLPA